MIRIDRDVARRFILGKQGLWPGRRWHGIDGVHQAMRAAEYLQLDPLQIIARSQDIQLHSRVLDYRPGMWEQATYQERQFFDWGGWLAVRPMDELPCWRRVMRREAEGSPDHDTRIQQMGREHADAVAEMRIILQERGMVSNRDFSMASRARTHSYRGRKDSSLALYYLWCTGEVMTHHRENFERVYALAETVAPAHLLYEASETEVERFLIKKEIAFASLARLNRAPDAYFRGAPLGRVQQICEALLAEGEICVVEVEGWKHLHYALGSDAGILSELSAGRLPQDWNALGPTTQDEVVFLSPLDPVSARGRAKILFGFDYVWEVYKPLHKRKYGYYILPVLWGERLVARFDSKLDRKINTFVILGLWLEDPALAGDEAFAEAFAAGLARFVAFLGADKLDINAIAETPLRRRLSSIKDKDVPN